MTNKRKVAWLLSLVMVLTLVLSGCGKEAGTPAGNTAGTSSEAPAGEVFEFKIAHLQNKGDAGADAITYLGEILEEKSGGRIKVTIYGSKSMAGGDTELGEIVRQNTVQMVPIPTHTLAAMADIPEYKVFEFPYLFDSWDQIYTVLDSDLAKGWAKVLEDQAGVVVYDGLVKGWLSIGTKKGPINTPADLAGEKVRTMSTDMQMGLINSLGSGATIVAYGELYTAIQQGTVDGALTASSLFLTDRFAEVINHLSVIRATAHFHLPVVNKAWLDSLPEDLRAIFDECMKEYVAKARQLEEEADAAALVALAENENVAVRVYTDEELIPFKEATKEMWDQFYDLPGEGVMDQVLELLGKERP
jgi:TRAP-type C4-dicarboxylate transport system substrate-binding protein